MRLKSYISVTIVGLALLASSVAIPVLAEEEATSASDSEEVMSGPAQGVKYDTQTRGGMVEAEEGLDEYRNIMDEIRAMPASSALPSCRAITYSGSSGYISVQTNSSSKVAWGITMTPLSLSVGRWDIDTWLNGKKTTSGFHRTTTGPYIPHGSIQARKGQTFVVTATLVSANGRTYRNVPNACTVP